MNDDANQPLNKKQLFIRNLSYETTKEELEQLFQEVGPLKNISIATEADGKSKGYGFVKFALEEDAEAALTKLQGHDLHGRKMNLQFGVKKDVKESKKRKSEAVDAEETVPAPQPVQKIAKSEPVKAEAAEGEDAKESGEHVRRSRQILVFGVPVDVNKRVFKAVLQKISRKPVEIELIKQDHKLSASLHIITPPGKVMLLTAISRQEAAKLLNALNEGTINNLGFAKFLGKGKENESDEEDEEDDALHALLVKNRLKERLVARTLADVSELELRKRKCRLIVRNLSFQATAQNVIDKLKRFGPIVEVDVPTTTVEKKPRTKGASTDAAEQETLLKERVKGFAFVTFLCEKDAKSALESVDLKICNRVVAIDPCMSKETYLKYGKESESEEKQESGNGGEKEEKDGNEDEEADEEDGGDEEDDGDENEDEEEGEEDGEDDEDDDDEEDDEESAEEAETEKPSLTGDVREGRTVFIRGLPFDAAPVDIKRVLGKYGRIEMALIVKDKATGVSKGCAFVKYAEKSFADLCLTATAEGVTIKDKLCKVDLAVDKDSVEKLKTDAKVGKDKRNLYLANEGLVTDASQVISDHDREKRLRAQSDKKKKLQNPLFFVSNNRLSIRNLGKNVTDQDLRVACLKATKLGLERGLVTTQDMKNLQLAQGSRWNTTDSAVSATADPLQVPAFDGRHCVKSAKIMVDLDKVRNSIAQSRGYAFVEFHHHAFALACLRQLNNNSMYENLASAVGGGAGRLMVEFSLENIRKVKILRERTERAKQRNQKAATDETGEQTEKTEKTKKPRKARKNKRDEKESSSEPDAKRVKVEKTEQPSPDANNASKEGKNLKISNVKLNNKVASKKRVRKPAKKSDNKQE